MNQAASDAWTEIVKSELRGQRNWKAKYGHQAARQPGAALMPGGQFPDEDDELEEVKTSRPATGASVKSSRPPTPPSMCNGSHSKPCCA